MPPLSLALKKKNNSYHLSLQNIHRIFFVITIWLEDSPYWCELETILQGLSAPARLVARLRA